MSTYRYLLPIVFAVFNCSVLAQTTSPALKAPDNWNSETINFPLGFAPAIDFVGYEEVRFAPGWSDKTSEQFWAYHFTWFIEKHHPMTEDRLSELLNKYYDGLMQLVLNNASDAAAAMVPDETISIFIQTQEGFSGKVRVFDAFFSKDYMMLYVKVREKFCNNTNRQIISFDITPRNFKDDLWTLFQSVEVVHPCK
jgi:hypothetical protein